MRKIVNGRLYDTDTAEKISSYEYGNPGDFTRVFEELYRKKNGEFFIYGGGGWLSKYAKSVGDNSYSGSETIIPLSDDEARAWLEEYGTADEYEDAFGCCEE